MKQDIGMQFTDNTGSAQDYRHRAFSAAEHSALRRQFFMYISRSILSRLGMACYYVADAFFVARCAGPDGLAALNLASPPYYLIFGLGALLAGGSSILYKLHRHTRPRAARTYFTQALLFGLLLSLPLMAAGLFFAGPLLALHGARGHVLAIGTPYLRIILLFTPLFVLNYIITAFVRNDSDPSLAMTAAIASSLFNIVGDYILMFPLNMGLTGAALATALSPLISIALCLPHWRRPDNSLHLVPVTPDVQLLCRVCRLGLADCTGECSVAVVIIVYNLLILDLQGNTGVAAYGIVSNVSLFVQAIYRGMAEGAQPLISDACGRGDHSRQHALLRIELTTALLVSLASWLLLALLAGPTASLFNSTGSAPLQSLAVTGIRLFFIAYIPGALNIALAGYYAATGSAGLAALVSFLRGFAAIIVLAILLAHLLGMPGIWLSQAAAELLTLLVALEGLRHFSR